MFAGFYFWWPKMTGKMLNNQMGKVHFWLLFIGFNMTFLVQHWAGVEGQVRRTANYPFLPGNVTTLNVISTVGSWMLGAVGAAVHLERLHDHQVRREGHRGRPVGLRLLA